MNQGLDALICTLFLLFVLVTPCIMAYKERYDELKQKELEKLKKNERRINV